jgi:hypothetical protein
MEFGSTILNLAIVIGLVVLLIVALILHQFVIQKKNEKFGKGGESKEKPTIILDEKEDKKKCEICYGAIEDDPVAICGKCGRIFHDACAKPTGACPYCNTKYDEMEVREPERTRCPICGRFIKGNICPDCDAVVPIKDGTFTCKCGNTVDCDKPVCKVCGAVYETAMRITEKK